WARPDDVDVWLELVRSFTRKTRPPEPPDTIENRWAPSGMEDLSSAFEWAIQNSADTNAELWRFHYGTWLAGRGKTEEAIHELSTTILGVASALLARLYQAKGDIASAAAAMQAIRDPWLQLHPEIVVERDKILRALGPSTIPQREQ